MKLIENIKTNYSRMIKIVNTIKAKTNHSFLDIYLNIRRCCIKYNINAQDYLDLELYELKDKDKESRLNINNYHKFPQGYGIGKLIWIILISLLIHYICLFIGINYVITIYTIFIYLFFYRQIDNLSLKRIIFTCLILGLLAFIIIYIYTAYSIDYLDILYIFNSDPFNTILVGILMLLKPVFLSLLLLYFIYPLIDRVIDNLPNKVAKIGTIIAIICLVLYLVFYCLIMLFLLNII